jgi:hypothetical protein
MPELLGAPVPELLLLLEVEVEDGVPECWLVTTATAMPVPATPITAVATAALVARRIQRALGAVGSFASFGFMPQQSPGPAQPHAKGTSSLDQVLLRFS